MNSVSRQRLARPYLWLSAVAIAYALVQFATMDIQRFLAWDEAIYASEVSRFRDAIFLDAHRARGITLVAAPVVQLTHSIAALRTYLVFVSGAGLFLAFLPWIRTIGWLAVSSAAIFASSWLTIFYGSELMPNLFTALFVVAAAGLSVSHVDEPREKTLLGVAVCVAAVAFLRPLDGATTIAALAVLPLLVRKKAAVQGMVSGAIGFGVGLAPWLVEAWVRWGGPLARLDRTRELVGDGAQNNVIEYLRLLDGPLSGPDRTADLGVGVVIWLVLLLTFAGLALLLGREFRDRAALCVVGAFLLALPYLGFAEAAAPRFMLPATGLLAIGASIGFRGVVRPAGAAVKTAVAVGLVLVLFSLNIGPLMAMSDGQSVARARALVLVNALETRSEPGSCFVSSSTGYPQIAYASGCDGTRYTGVSTTDVPKLEDAANRGLDAFILLSNPDQIEDLSTSSMCEPVVGLEDRNWHICRWGH